jgi:hypothetical protein
VIPTQDSAGGGCQRLGKQDGSGMQRKESYLGILIGKSSEYVEALADLPKDAVL